MIKHCINAPAPCKSEYQDRMYGAGNRVMNEGNPKGTFTCTVCNKQSSASTGKKGK